MAKTSPTLCTNNRFCRSACRVPSDAVGYWSRVLEPLRREALGLHGARLLHQNVSWCCSWCCCRWGCFACSFHVSPTSPTPIPHYRRCSIHACTAGGRRGGVYLVRHNNARGASKKEERARGAFSACFPTPRITTRNMRFLRGSRCKMLICFVWYHGMACHAGPSTVEGETHTCGT